MNEFIKTYADSRMNLYNGGQSTVALPVSVDSRANSNPSVNGKNVLEYGNPTYNQLSVKNRIPDENSLLYSQVLRSLDKEGKVLLKNLAKNGKLYSKDAIDGSTTLENLYRIIQKPRLSFFSSKNIIKETLRTLNDPYIITQNFGNLPSKIIPQLLNEENRKMAQEQTGEVLSVQDINFNKGHTCPAASIEFNLADRRPSEFVRYIEGLTSPGKSVKTKVEYIDLLPGIIQSVGIMAEQHTQFKPIDWKSAEITIRPDEKAYLRADVQEDYRAPNSRSMVDVLMQSAFMQLGSHGSYNSLTDTRSKETGDGRGLNQFEIAYVESLVDGKSRKVPIVYMELNDDATKILKYNYSPEETQKHILDSLDKGTNIITGFLTNIDNKGNVITPDGHEILLTGYKYDKTGKLWLKYNDTDDGDYFAPSWIEASGFIPTIHHANVPESVLQDSQPA